MSVKIQEMLNIEVIYVKFSFIYISFTVTAAACVRVTESFH